MPLPLEGIRIVELAVAWAGAVVTRLMADMGAEIIKVESRARMDLRGALRPEPGAGMYPNNDPGQRPWNRAGLFNERHRGKLSVTIELNLPQGKELFKKIVAASDGVTVNFSAPVMKRLGVGYDVLSQVNPRLVMVSMPGHGESGPEASYVSYGPTMEQLTGISSLTGYPGGPPMNTNTNVPDPLSGVLAAGALLVGILDARRTGRGCYIELAQREATARLIGDALMEYSMNKRLIPRMGNRDRLLAPHGCYRCAGEDKWIAIAVGSDQEWKALCNAMGQPGLAEDPRFANPLQRHQYHDEIDTIIATWTRDKHHIALMQQLQEAGVAAGAALNAAETAADRNLEERRFFEEVEHPEAGLTKLFGIAWDMSETPPRIRNAAPTLGQHNRYVLENILKLSGEEIQQLEQEGVVGTLPLGL